MRPLLAQAHDSASAAEDAARWEEERRVSRYAEGLPQLETGMGRWERQIPSDSSLWACDETGVKENLWLNLSTGFIGSGRQVRTLGSDGFDLVLSSSSSALADGPLWAHLTCQLLQSCIERSMSRLSP